MCNNIPGLVNIERQLCQENPDVMVATRKGAKLGVEECQRQMKDQMWNCSTAPRDIRVFGKILKKGKPEFSSIFLFILSLLFSGSVSFITPPAIPP